MPLVRFPLALLSVWCMLGAEKPVPRVAPIYSAASIVNAADNQSGALAPNAIGTIYGANLAYSIAAVTPERYAGRRASHHAGWRQRNHGIDQQFSRGLVLCFADADQFLGSAGSAAGAGLRLGRCR